MLPGLKEMSEMDTHAKKNSVATLKKLRDVYQGQLDASVIAEIDAVIAALEDGCDCQEAKTSENWGMRALALIAEVIRLVTNISELMK